MNTERGKTKCNPTISFTRQYYAWVADCTCGYQVYCDTKPQAAHEVKEHLGQ